MTSTIKVDNIQDQDGNNIINENSNTITIGASGDTVTLASGASQSGFGRTGTVDWQTGSIKTSTFTAANGEGYFVNTSSGAVTANLPAGSAGAIVSFSDYTRTFGTNNLTVTPNGSEKIGGVAASAYLNVNGQAITLVYVDATEGWINIQNAEDTEVGVVPTFISATGGTITTSGDFKIHTFTGPGTFTVCSVGNPVGSDSVDYLVVAGGGGGGRGRAGGGGAGGARASSGTASGSYTAGPIAACVAAIPVTAQGYPVVVGGGGSGSTGSPNNNGTIGSTSSGLSISSAGGGAGLGENQPGPGGTGGSGGGGARRCDTGQNGGAGNTPPVSPSQGNSGGNSFPGQGGGGGGGGAVAAGSNSVPVGGGGQGGQGGTGVTSCITASPVGYAGGGGGGNSDDGPSSNLPNAPSVGGGGSGGTGIPPSPGPVSLATAGTANTGGGGGGGAHRYSPPDNYRGAAGGSGIVIIRYKFQ
tara:strand:- start:1444 stop:2859 length:1416 start_codon:yes stop_codon:yes gene_type:complete